MAETDKDEPISPAPISSAPISPAPAPVFLVKGDDESLRAQATSGLLSSLVGDDSLAFEELSGDTHDMGAVLDACQTPAFLSDRRVVLVREVGRFLASDAARLVEYLADPNPTTVLVLVAGGGQTTRALADAVKKRGTVVDTTVGTGRARGQWLAEHLRDAPVRLDAESTTLIGDHLGDDLGRLASLLQTLAASFGEGERLSAADVRPFLGEAGGAAPWDLTDAIDRGDAETALVQLRRQLVGGERHPLVVLATLHRHIAAMLRVDGAPLADDQAAAALLGTSAFPARKALSQARKLGSDRIAKALELIAEADLDLRGKREWPDELVLEVLVARLARLAPRGSSRAGR